MNVRAAGTKTSYIPKKIKSLARRPMSKEWAVRARIRIRRLEN